MKLDSGKGMPQGLLKGFYGNTAIGLPHNGEPGF